MPNFNYDTYCGVYCGGCSILMAQKTDHKDKFATLMSIEHTQLVCQGCKSETVFANCEKCQIRNCARNKKIEHCALDCADFPCKIWKEGNGHTKEFVDKLPHMKVIRKNLQNIKKDGVNKWLEEQEKLWQCPECNTGFSWYTEKCTNCGRDLEQLKDYNNPNSKS